jgi:uracil-DNA glycosylase
MPLDERRLAMLHEMGVPFWRPLGARLPAEEPGSAPAPGPAGVRGPGAPAGAGISSASALSAGPGVPEGRARADALKPAPDQQEGDSPLPAQAAPAPSPGQDVSALDWPALREAVAGCRACGLCEKRRQTVFGVGHTRAHWMVVGEAPGEQEDLRGAPFVGAAGQLLDQMLRALGLTRAEAAAEGAPPLTPEQQVYIVNTLKCRPPGNRNPEPAELARCEPFLVRQIELVQPRVILAMGRFAVQALLRIDEPIGRLRGRVHRYQGVPLIVTYHPAYLLRNLLDKAKAWDDLCLAMDTVEGLGQEEPA